MAQQSVETPPGALLPSRRSSSSLSAIRFRDLLGLDAGCLDHLRPFWDFGLDAAGEFFRCAVDCIKTQRREFLSSVRLNHRLADLAMKQFYNGLRRVGGDKNARYRSDS